MNSLTKAILVIKTIDNFPEAFLDKFHLISGKRIYKIKNKNLKFTVRAGTEDLPEIIVVASGYEYDFSKIVLPKKPTIVDLGAHIGSFSVLAAKKFKDKGRIFSFEPDKENFLLLKENLALNKLKSVKAFNLGISDRKGKVYLKNNINTDAYYIDLKTKNKPNCEVTTLPLALNKIGLKKVDLLKIDVEGSEYEILNHKPTISYIKKNVSYVFIEYHELDPKRNYKKIKKVIEDNFTILGRHANILTLMNKKINNAK
ncbi:MAG TPA: FkbM family methyltransferase [Patescibacteria group bacterium]|nr:FkbM family methyltransferase [Patescibacteria group bacterium]